MKKINDLRLVRIYVGIMLVAGIIVACGKSEAVVTETEPETMASYTFEPGEEYSLIWSDEFEGDSLDTSKWSYQYGDGGDYGNVGWGNGESQIYTDDPKNVSVSDGTLKITALKEQMPNGGMGFTSGRIRTLTDDNEALFATTFGRVEAKIMMEGGSGIWPAFWMLPADTKTYGTWAASGEIDIMEVRGRVPNMSTGTAHFGKSWPDNVYEGGEYTFPEGTDVRDYHVYAVEWEPEEIRWYIDDVCFFTLKNWYARSGANATEFTSPAPFDVPFYILFNVAVGGNFDPDAILKDESFPGIMTVDYVRVYQKTAGYEEALRAANAKGKEVEDAAKAPLLSGDSIYNGTFDQGLNHVGYWKMDGIEAEVDPFDVARRLSIKASGELPRLYQTGLHMEADSTYGVRVDTFAEVETQITIRIFDDAMKVIYEEVVEVEAADGKVFAVKMDNAVNCENATFEISFEKDAQLQIDNIMLRKLS